LVDLSEFRLALQSIEYKKWVGFLGDCTQKIDVFYGVFAQMSQYEIDVYGLLCSLIWRKSKQQ